VKHVLNVEDWGEAVVLILAILSSRVFFAAEMPHRMMRIPPETRGSPTQLGRSSFETELDLWKHHRGHVLSWSVLPEETLTNDECELRFPLEFVLDVDVGRPGGTDLGLFSFRSFGVGWRS
jgi:hypothetical protein